VLGGELHRARVAVAADAHGVFAQSQALNDAIHEIEQLDDRIVLLADTLQRHRDAAAAAGAAVAGAADAGRKATVHTTGSDVLSDTSAKPPPPP
jgi:hypothetical protein